SLIDDAVEAGVPLIFFNREPVEEDLMRGEKVYYVGSDAKETAILQSMITTSLWYRDRQAIDTNDNDKIEYVMLEGEMGHQDAMIRTEWSIRSLTQNGIATEKLQSGIANWDRNQAAAMMEGWLNSFGKSIELVIANNDDMALGAADAMEKLGIKGIEIVGIDATPQGLEAVGDGRLLGTVDCNTKTHADSIFRLACGLAIDGNVPPDITLENGRYLRVKLHTVTKKDISE
ncbi:MAG: substrate-binding domain-containing protein, partial [Angelakisella sp.]